MDFKEIKEEFGDCDWMRVFLNGYAVDAVLWLIDRVEELERRETMSIEDCNAKQAREGQISTELKKAENTMDRVTGKMEGLESRLIEVLHEETSSSSGTIEAKTGETLVPLAHRIRMHGEILCSLENRLSSVLDRLELQ